MAPEDFVDRDRGTPPQRTPGLLWVRLAAGVALLAFAALTATAPVASAGSPALPLSCNGHPDLCTRTLDQVVLPGTHNSMSAEELGWNLPNQTYDIPGQLTRGARAFLIDTHYGREILVGGETVIENVDRAEGERIGAKVYLCHVSCRGGASDLVEVLDEVRQFLETHPNEVLVFVNEDYVAPRDFAFAVEESGLIEHVYTEPLDHWPTLAEMIESDGRVLFLSQSEIGDVPWYHLAYEGVMRETPYSFNDLQIEMLTSPQGQVESCRANRGGNTGGLFLMNHWILGNGVSPRVEFAETVNTKQVLVNRARVCETVRGKLPTILAVDFLGVGDVVGAARQLNGLSAPEPPDRPGLTPAQIRKKARALCRKKKGKARKACIKKQTARLKEQNARSRSLGW